jgi:phage shock protein A
MYRLMKRTWAYVVAMLSRKVDDAADPEIQVEQAIEEGKRQHKMLVDQAAVVIGNQRQLEIKLGRSMDEVERLRGAAGQALVLSDRARASGDEAKAGSLDDAAHAFAMKLVAEQAAMEDLKVLHDHAAEAAVGAKLAVEQNALALRRRLAERTQLMSQIQQTKMQERMNEALGQLSALAPAGNVPTLEQVREKIETRYARALGTAELGRSSVEVRMLEVEKASLDAEAAMQLASLRASLALQSGDAADTVAAVADDGEGGGIQA